jgi:hypothetical protein
LNIPLIYWENLAALRAAGAIYQAMSIFRQHGAGEQQSATDAALMAVTPADKRLALNILLSEMNQPKTP